MAATDSQKQLLTLIRDFASEKSQGERRLVGLKKRMEELHLELNVANTELEEAKRIKEITEQELKGYEVELALNDASIQTIEARISLIRDEISSIGSEVDGLKNEEGAARKFQETIACKFQKEHSTEPSADTDQKIVEKVATEVNLRNLEDTLAHVISQTNKEEQEYLAEQNIQKQVQQEYVDLQRKVALMEVMMKATKELQDLTRQTFEMEKTCASLGEELQNRSVCPTCHTDNVEALGGILQANKAT